MVNDGSTDNTADLVRAYKNVRLINLCCNIGIGGAVQAGFKYAVRHGYDAALQFDADGQHRVEEIPKLLKSIESGAADVVIGSRFLKEDGNLKNTTFSRRAGIKFFELVNGMLAGVKIKDNTSGFRAYNNKALSFMDREYPDDYPEPEAVILLAKQGFKIEETGVEMDARHGGLSSIRGLMQVYYMVKVMIALIMDYIRPAGGSKNNIHPAGGKKGE